MGNQDDLVREQFKKQAKGFSDNSLTMNNQSYIKWMLDGLSLSSEINVLDVAAGTGILSRAMSPFVHNVISIDLSEDMISEGDQINKSLGLTNIRYVHGNVENMPFQENQFDVVISRFAFHHFIDPQKVLGEMRRVSCKTVAIIDMISPEDDYLCKQYNYYEKLRDPSHTKALKQSECLNLFNDLNIKILTTETLDVPVNVNKWMGLAKTNENEATHIKNHINEELSTGEILTGLSPFIENDLLMFKQKWIKVLGII